MQEVDTSQSLCTPATLPGCDIAAPPFDNLLYILRLFWQHPLSCLHACSQGLAGATEMRHPEKPGHSPRAASQHLGSALEMEMQMLQVGIQGQHQEHVAPPPSGTHLVGHSCHL